MRRLKIRLRKADIILIPIAAVAMYMWQSHNIERSEKLKLDRTLQECKKEQAQRSERQESCDEYAKMLYGG